MDICRGCMSSSEALVDIFSKWPFPNSQFILADMVNDLFKFKIQRDDDFPQKMCVSCGLDVQVAFRIKHKFEETHKLLSKKVNKNKVIDPLESSILQEALLETPILQGPLQESSTLEESLHETAALHEALEESCGLQEIEENLSEPDDNLLTVLRCSRRTNDVDCSSSSSVDGRRRSASSDSNDNPKAYPHKCSDCKMAFRTKSDHKKHRLIHDLPFKCTHCSKSFKYNSKLQEHLPVHTADRPFKCSQCEKDYRSKAGLSHHINTVHPQKD